MWEAYHLRNPADLRGRIRGVSILDRSSRVVVWTDQALYEIWFYQTAFVNKLASAAAAEQNFDPATGVLTWANGTYPMHGDCGPGGERIEQPLRTTHPGGDRLVPDPETDSLLVLGPGGEVRQTIPDFAASSDLWTAAGFSGDGRSLVVADPRGVRVFRYVPAKGTEVPRWASAGNLGDQKAILRAVIDQPDEDTPRLAYADWLDEHGDAGRAEFIRLQCRLAERERDRPVPTVDPDLVRATELIRILGERWRAELPVIRGIHWSDFRRGFPGVIVASPTTLVRSGKRVWAVAPVELVRISGLNETGARALAGSPLYDRIRVLTVDRYYSSRDGIGPLRALLHTPRATVIRRLSFTSGHLASEGIEAVLASPYLTGLEWLNVGSYAFEDGHANTVLTSPTFANLRSGVFRSSRLSEATRIRIRARFPRAIV